MPGGVPQGLLWGYCYENWTKKATPTDTPKEEVRNITDKMKQHIFDNRQAFLRGGESRDILRLYSAEQKRIFFIVLILSNFYAGKLRYLIFVGSKPLSKCCFHGRCSFLQPRAKTESLRSKLCRNYSA